MLDYRSPKGNNGKTRTAKPIYKKTLLAAASAALALALCGLVLFCLVWEYGAVFPNWGFESGYWGQYNRVKNVIESIPDAAIVDERRHEDATLEDFEFNLRTGGGHTVRVGFFEGSVQMKERNRDRIRRFVLAEIEKAKNHPAPVDQGPSPIDGGP